MSLVRNRVLLLCKSFFLLFLPFLCLLWARSRTAFIKGSNHFTMALGGEQELLYRTVGSSENPGGRVVMWWDNLLLVYWYDKIWGPTYPCPLPLHRRRREPSTSTPKSTLDRMHVALTIWWNSIFRINQNIMQQSYVSLTNIQLFLLIANSKKRLVNLLSFFQILPSHLFWYHFFISNHE